MCHFVTLILPTDDAIAVKAVMDRHGRAAKPLDNLSVRKRIRDAERQYLTTPGMCDCGTVLAPPYDTPEAREKKLERQAARMRRKGWSEAKIARAIEDLRKAGARPERGGIDSLELWSAVLRDLGETLKLPYAGLLVRFYSGAIATEAFDATRREVPSDVQTYEALRSLKHDEVTIFQTG